MPRARKSMAARPRRAPVARRRAAPARRSMGRGTSSSARSQVVRVVLEAPQQRPMMSEAGKLLTPVFPGKAKF